MLKNHCLKRCKFAGVILFIFNISSLFAQVPSISSFAPTNGPVGTTVTISGSNFSAIPAENIVFFGVARAIVASATATQLVVNVPAGANYQPVTVTSNGLTATSSNIFDVTFTGAGPFAANSFNKRLDFPVPNYPNEVLVADLDGDGKTDIIAYNSSTFSLFRNTSTIGNTSFDTRYDITPGGGITRAVIADIDGDGKPDLIFADENGLRLVILKNTSAAGTFSFAAPLIIADRAQPTGITVADFDNDGKPDIAASSGVNNTFSVYRNTTTSGNISFAPAVIITSITRDAFGGIFSGDLDGDGKADLITTGYISDNQACITFKNTSTVGNISFNWVNVYPSGYHPQNLIIADIDGDGKSDIAAPVGYGSFVIYRNTTVAGGVIDFANPVSYTSGQYPTGIAIGDLDGDGRPDLVVPDGFFPGHIGVFKNNSTAGSLQLEAKVDYTKGTSSSNVSGLGYGGAAVADFDGDGRADMVVSNYQGATISVSTNTINAPVIASFTPASAITGATVTITGTNLNGANKVSFGGVDAASFTVKSSTSITAVVGAGASGVISVATPVATGTAAGFTFLPAPILMSFTPLAAGPGKTVTLTGAHFTGATAVTFGGVNAKSFTVVSDISITAVVDAVAKSGSIAVTVPGGTVSLDGYIFAPNPTITSVAPGSGPVGTSVVITGTNFNAGKTGNIVYFGAAKAVVTAAATQQLTVTVSTGAAYSPVSVLNTASGLTGFSATSYLPTFATKYSIAASDFDPEVDFTAANGGRTSVISDIDGDGKPDVIVVNPVSNTVSVFRNTAVSGTITANSLAVKIDFATGNGPQAVIVADIDGDGKPDMAVANLASNSVSVFLNTSTNGNISFAAPISLVTGNGPHAITAGDLDGDGKVDLITANSTDNAVSVFRNTSTPGNVSFALKVDFATGLTPHGVVTGDIDGDGKPEILTANFAGGSFSLLQNTSSPGLINSSSFATHSEWACGAGPESITLGDIDQNGTTDVIVANSKSNTVSVFANAIVYITPVFKPKVDLVTDANPTSVTLADLDGDGRPDIVSANSAGNTLSVFRNTMPFGGAPTTLFAGKVVIAVTNSPSDVSIGDLDGDGKPDIITTNSGSNTMAVLHNNPTPQVIANPPPVVSSFAPGTGAIGTDVKINGKNFNPSASQNVVYMGAEKAKVNSASATQLDVTVPASATYQPLSVLNTANNLTGYSTAPFNTTFASKNGISATDLSAAVKFATASSPYSVAVGDIDGDGKPDLVITNPGSRTISVYRNASVTGAITASSFTTKVDFTVASVPENIIITDIDGDGKPDMLVNTLDYQGYVSIFRNTAVAGVINSGSFAARVDFAVTNASRMIIADMDGDGKPDILLGGLTILLNNSSPGIINASSFPQQSAFSLKDYIIGFTVYDINNDGKPDIIAIEANNIAIVLNHSAPGNLSLAPETDLNNSAAGNAIAVADVDGDGKPDIITSSMDGSITLEHNIATGKDISANSFESHADFPSQDTQSGAGPVYLIVADIDGDGKPDVLSISGSLNYVSVYRNISTASTPSYSFFDRNVDFAAGTKITGLAVADIDGDGKPDIITVNQGDNNFSVLRNNPVTPLAINPPVITSVSPILGQVGTTVTINGKNFDSNVNGNVVYLGATKAIINAATAESLSVTVPAGASYEWPSVLNTGNGLTGYAPGKFITTFPSKNSITTKDFDPPVAVYNYPANYVRTADIDGDGKPDLIFHDGFQHVFVMRNLSAKGTIEPASFGEAGNPVELNVGDGPQAIKVIDIDGDGKPDLLVTYYSFYGIGISVLLNQSTPGHIAFAPKVDIPYNSVAFGANTYTVETGDVDGDGRPDILIANTSLKGVSVLPNTCTPGKVSFVSRYDFEAGRGSSAVNLVDIDGDGKPDLVVTNVLDNTISILQNITPKGVINAASFSKHVDFTTVNGPASLAIGDLNGDGKPDIVVVAGSTYPNPSICVLQNNSSPGVITAASLAPKVDLVPQNYYKVAIADVDGDGKPDIVTRTTIIRNLKGTGNITNGFFSPTAVSINQNVGFADFYMDDIDGDNKPDFVGSDGNGVYIIRNNPLIGAGQPVISSFSPQSAAAGATVTLTGLNFSGVSSVTFGGIAAASFKINSATTITAIVGAGKSGSIIVTAPGDTSSLTGFSFIPPIINASGPTTFYTGGNVVLTTDQGVGYSYQWQRDGVDITGATSSSYTATQSGVYTVSVTVNGFSQTSAAVNVTVLFGLPATNFKIAITGATCKGSANGFITVSADENLSYTASITGNGLNGVYPFTTTLTINNLAAGTYNVCFTVAGQTSYQQCFTAVVTEPKDLSLYAAIEKKTHQAVLSLEGADTYHIHVNGIEQITANNQVTVNLMNGVNHIELSSDRPCQGVILQDLVIADSKTAFPNPFENVIYVNIGDTVAKKITVGLYDSFGRPISEQIFINQSGVVQVDVPALRLGVYILRVVADNRLSTFKMNKK